MGFFQFLGCSARCLLFFCCLGYIPLTVATTFTEPSIASITQPYPVEKRHTIPALGSYDIVYRSAPSKKLQELGRASVTVCLRNGLIAHLISDPNLTVSAAGMCVRSGSWSNPSDAPGLAHFVEHLLFMGSKKYPIETDFTRYVAERGGEYNAFTSQDKTVYGFSINHEGLEGGLDRFAQFFTAPLFSPSAIMREKHAVHHEFEDHRNSDEMRIWRVLKETGSSTHANHLFSCGNLTSLANVGQKEVVAWYNKHYVAENMQLIVVSSKGLQQLIGMVVQSFSKMQKGEKSSLDLSGTLLSEHQHGHMIYLTPNHNNRSLQLIWEMPLEAEEYLPSLELLQIVLDHEGEGSLFSILSSEGLARGVGVDYWQLEKNHILFLIEVALTKKGVACHEEVMATCFSVLNAIKEQGVPQVLYQKILQTHQELDHEYTPSRPFDFVMAKVSKVGAGEAGIEPRLSPLQLQLALDLLRPNLGVYFLMAPGVEHAFPLEALEKWMAIPYHRKKMDDKLLESYTQIEPHQDFKVLVKEDIDDDSSLMTDLEENSRDVELLVDEVGRKVAFALREKEEESWVLLFQFKTPFSTSSTQHAASLLLYLAMIYESLEKSEPIDHLTWTLMPLDSEISVIVKVEGEQKREKILQFFSMLTTRDFSLQNFLNWQQHYVDHYKGDPDPLELAQVVTESLLNPGFFTTKDLSAALEKITFDEFSTFHKMLLPSLMVEAVFYGPQTREQALTVWRGVEEILFTAAEEYKAPEVERRQSLCWNEHEKVFIDTHRFGHAYMLVMNISGANRESWAMQTILSQILSEEFFDDLRTNQQLAYKLYTWAEPSQDRLMQFFGIQSSSTTSKDLGLAVECFLARFTKDFTILVSRDRVNLIKHMIIAGLKRRLQTEITKEQARSVKASIEVVKGLQYEQIQLAAEMFFSEKNTKRLSVHIDGK